MRSVTFRGSAFVPKSTVFAGGDGEAMDIDLPDPRAGRWVGGLVGRRARIIIPTPSPPLGCLGGGGVVW